jgi:hypothetical protein
MTGVTMKISMAALSAALAGIALSSCGAPAGVSQTSKAMTGKAADVMRLVRMTTGERLAATRPNLPAGTKVYRMPMALIESPGETTFVPKADVLEIAGTHVVVRLNGVSRSIDNARVTYRDDIGETYVPPGIAVPAQFKNLPPHDIVK